MSQTPILRHITYTLNHISQLAGISPRTRANTDESTSQQQPTFPFQTSQKNIQQTASTPTQEDDDDRHTQFDPNNNNTQTPSTEDDGRRTEETPLSPAKFIPKLTNTTNSNSNKCYNNNVNDKKRPSASTTMTMTMSTTTMLRTINCANDIASFDTYRLAVSRYWKHKGIAGISSRASIEEIYQSVRAVQDESTSIWTNTMLEFASQCVFGCLLQIYQTLESNLRETEESDVDGMMVNIMEVDVDDTPMISIPEDDDTDNMFDAQNTQPSTPTATRQASTGGSNALPPIGFGRTPSIGLLSSPSSPPRRITPSLFIETCQSFCDVVIVAYMNECWHNYHRESDEYIVKVFQTLCQETTTGTPIDMRCCLDYVVQIIRALCQICIDKSAFHCRFSENNEFEMSCRLMVLMLSEDMRRSVEDLAGALVCCGNHGFSNGGYDGTDLFVDDEDEDETISPRSPIVSE